MASKNDCTTDSQYITYCLIGGEYYVGTNITYGYAYVNKSTPDEIIIPKTIKSIPVLYIGQNAFDVFRYLRKVNILAQIIAIHRGAFANCPKLEYINIPSSCKYLYSNAIQCYNNGNKSPGTLTVLFDINPSIEYIGSQLFSFKEFTHVYLCQPVNASIPYLIFRNTSVTIFSTSLFSLNGTTTTLTYSCSPKPLCTKIIKKLSNIYINQNLLFISILNKN